MINISKAVEDIFAEDDLAQAAARRGFLNLSSYAREIRPAVQNRLLKPAGEGSIVTALSRIIARLPADAAEPHHIIRSLSVHANLEGMTYERSEQTSRRIREIYSETKAHNQSFVTVTQGMNEITVVADAPVAQGFRRELTGLPAIYDRKDLVGITVKFGLESLERPNTIYWLTRHLAFKSVNLVEVVSTATELTYIISKSDLASALKQLQKAM
jgi:hypothetical protein